MNDRKNEGAKWYRLATKHGKDEAEEWLDAIAGEKESDADLTAAQREGRAVRQALLEHEKNIENIAPSKDGYEKVYRELERQGLSKQRSRSFGFSDLYGLTLQFLRESYIVLAHPAGVSAMMMAVIGLSVLLTTRQATTPVMHDSLTLREAATPVAVIKMDDSLRLRGEATTAAARWQRMLLEKEIAHSVRFEDGRILIHIRLSPDGRTFLEKQGIEPPAEQWALVAFESGGGGQQ